jgi:23S rRNA pseudouridine2605 synthase
MKAPPSQRVHLERALSKLGLCSRAQAALRIAEGRVRVDGRVVRDPRRWVELPTERIEMDGLDAGPAASSAAPKRYFVLHKPRGFVTTRNDERGRRTVYDLLPADATARWIFPVGRLDRESEGLLLFTDDGPWADRLTDPAGHVEKTYEVEVDRAPSAAALDELRAGIELDGVRTLPARITPLPGRAFRVVLREGRNRQIRRMFEAVGARVTRLVRVRIGGLALDALAPGAGRWLTAEEARALGSSRRNR